ncbi:MAG: fumarylacetoacetate hydrolase family protein [Chromatiales bacterium]|nr:MAG: fumarylacetoacetate hydrolase family protein [Chromatiales bacterium]
MKFASLAAGGYGLVDSDGIRPVPESVLARYPTLRAALSADMLSWAAEAAAAGEAVATDKLALIPTIPDAGKIICIGMNYREHIKEMGRKPPRYPAFFLRVNDSLVGHEQPLIRPRLSTHFDWEGELAAVIGHTARHVSRADALEHVAGYTILQDGSLRDYQEHTTQFAAGKNFHQSGAMGPWLVTADEIPDPAELTLETRVSGEVMQRGEIADLCIDVPAIIEYLSGIMELRPGDVIATGTPSGVGAGRKPPRWLVAGDVVEVEISGIGVLRNAVVDED